LSFYSNVSPVPLRLAPAFSRNFANLASRSPRWKRPTGHTSATNRLRCLHSCPLSSPSLYPRLCSLSRPSLQLFSPPLQLLSPLSWTPLAPILLSSPFPTHFHRAANQRECNKHDLKNLTP
jgi:hypothetical protein